MLTPPCTPVVLVVRCSFTPITVMFGSWNWNLHTNMMANEMGNRSQESTLP
uniref:Uncharacterized protein n=1 Tax=Arundo donax TaxID=35708 RepID=A0A0A9DVY8_ARUDO